MVIRKYENFHLEEIINLYQSVGWTNYLERISVLEEAYANSLCVFVQDIIVLPEYQRKGIGTTLLKAVMDKYHDVYQMELLTDNTEKTKAFYRSVGFTASDDIGCVAFIRM